MKKRVYWFLIPAAALSLAACKKKEEVKATESPAAVADATSTVTPVPAPAVKTPALSADERAAKLGFVKFLPQDTEAVLSFHNGTKAVGKVKASKLWKLVQELMGIGPGIVPEGDEPETTEIDPAGNEPAGPAALFGTEITMALGKSTAEQAGNLLTLNSRMTYLQARSATKSLLTAIKSGDMSSVMESISINDGSEITKDLLEDPQSGIALLEKIQIPPVYFAFKSDKANLAVSAQQVAAMLENANLLGEMVEPVEVEQAGSKFQGYKILGEKYSNILAEDRESMEEELGAAMADRVLAAMAMKNLVVVSGTVGDYVVIFMGSSVDDLKLAADTAGSMAASKDLAFVDAYASKELAAVAFGRKEAMETLIHNAGGLADLTHGIRDGLAGSDGLGDTRDLEAMFQIVGEREAALRKLAGSDSLGMVAFYEQGLRIEFYGGTDNGMVDWKSPNKLACLGDSPNALLFANLTSDAVYDEKARAYLEALLETSYAITMKVTEVPMEGKQMEQFKEMAKLIDATFRPDMVELWDAFSNHFDGGLGYERAFLVDLQGGAPAVPGLPQVVVDKAKVPRVSIISPVTDRAKLAGAWDKINTTLTGTLAKVGVTTGQQIPMQKPISSEKDGNTTWFFPLPFFTDDFLPSVTVGDKWFVASSSKNQALDLIAKADAGGETREGFWFSMNFQALETYAKETYALIDGNSEALMGMKLSEPNKKLIRDSITVLGDLDILTVHSRREDGVLHSSVHFKTR